MNESSWEFPFCISAKNTVSGNLKISRQRLKLRFLEFQVVYWVNCANFLGDLYLSFQDNFHLILIYICCLIEIKFWKVRSSNLYLVIPKHHFLLFSFFFLIKVPIKPHICHIFQLDPPKKKLISKRSWRFNLGIDKNAHIFQEIKKGRKKFLQFPKS